MCGSACSIEKSGWFNYVTFLFLPTVLKLMTVNLMLQLSSRAAIRYINHQIQNHLNTQCIFLINMTQGNVTYNLAQCRVKAQVRVNFIFTLFSLQFWCSIYFSKLNLKLTTHLNCNKESNGISSKFIHFQITVWEGTVMNLRHLYFNKETEQKNGIAFMF